MNNKPHDRQCEDQLNIHCNDIAINHVNDLLTKKLLYNVSHRAWILSLSLSYFPVLTYSKFPIFKN